MSIFKNTAIAVLSIATFASTTMTADAGGRGHGNLGIGIVGGLIAGAAIANSRSRNYYDDDYYDERPVYRSRYQRHVNWCYSRYRSYSERSNTWITRSGRTRNCNSPYGR